MPSKTDTRIDTALALARKIADQPDVQRDHPTMTLVNELVAVLEG